MSRSATTWGRATALALVAMFALRSGHWTFCLMVAALIVGSALWRGGLAINRTGQFLLMMLALAVAWPLNLALNPEEAPTPRTLGHLGTVLGLVSLSLSVPRLWMTAPGKGESGTAAANLLGVLGLSQGASGWGYAVFVALWGGLQFAAIRAEDACRPPLSTLTTRHRLVLGAMVGITTLVALVMTLGIPPAQQWAMREFYYSFARAQTGFSTRMELGSMAEMADSDRLVLRVFGAKTDHLRGFVFRRYAGHGRWLGSRRAQLLEVRLPPATGDDTRRTRIVTVGGDATRYFLPLQAEKVRTDRESARVDVVGVLSAPSGERVEQVSFVSGQRDRLAVARPNHEDLQLPPSLVTELRGIARRWTAGQTTTTGRLDALARRLRTDFTYSLSFRRLPKRDPVLDFLTRDHQGHCEYFAAAMTLLARSLDIPARVVAGYRVNEANPLADHFVVRERDAHSWVEAWVPQKGWQTHDPTPAGAPAVTSDHAMSLPAALLDLAATWLTAVLGWFGDLTAQNLTLAVGALLLVWIVLRLARRIRKKSNKISNIELNYQTPLPAMDRLLDALDRAGAPRNPAEPLETYAHRLGQTETLGAMAAQAKTMLLRYATWRYGGNGDPGDLTNHLDKTARRLSD